MAAAKSLTSGTMKSLASWGCTVVSFRLTNRLPSHVVPCMQLAQHTTSATSLMSSQASVKNEAAFAQSSEKENEI